MNLKLLPTVIENAVIGSNVDFERFGDDDDFFMKENVFKTLIDQLEELNFDGLISPHLYGEPMSDHRMLSWSCTYKKTSKL